MNRPGHANTILLDIVGFFVQLCVAKSIFSFPILPKLVSDSTLLLLCQRIFGEDNVAVLVWPKTDPRFDQNRVEKPFSNIKIVHENIFVCFKEKSATSFNSISKPCGTKLTSDSKFCNKCGTSI